MKYFHVAHMITMLTAIIMILIKILLQ